MLKKKRFLVFLVFLAFLIFIIGCGVEFEKEPDVSEQAKEIVQEIIEDSTKEEPAPPPEPEPIYLPPKEPEPVPVPAPASAPAPEPEPVQQQPAKTPTDVAPTPGEQTRSETPKSTQPPASTQQPASTPQSRGGCSTVCGDTYCETDEVLSCPQDCGGASPAPVECTGGSDTGGVCGDCNSQWKRDCVGGRWGGWYCQNNVPGNFGQNCNYNACGQPGGKVGCWGCTGNTPPLNPLFGQPCNYNACGQPGGTVGCNGCTGPTPALPSGYNEWCNYNACGEAGGRIGCNGCTGPTPKTSYGDKCGNGGTLDCQGNCVGEIKCGDGICSAGEEKSCPKDCGVVQCSPNVGKLCNCNECGKCGVITCKGVCNVDKPAPLPGFYGQSCGVCGTIKCDGKCYDNPPLNYKDKCNRGPCGGTGVIDCGGYCTGKDPTPPNYGQSCGDGGTIGCDGKTCVGSGGDTTTSDNALAPDNAPLDQPGCTGSVTGTVREQGSNQPISSADVVLKRDLTTIDSTATNSQGSYTMASTSCGAYSLTASHPSYVSQVKNVNIAQQQAVIDFSLVLGSTCEADCTYAADNTVHSSCSGQNGCAFYDSTAANACNLAQPGWIRDYSPTQQIRCAEGAPYAKIQTRAKVTCEKGNLIETTYVVNYQGRLVKMVVATCG